LEDQEEQDPGNIHFESMRTLICLINFYLIGDEIEKEEKLLIDSAKSKDRQPTG
jgi:hypothetical protein